MTPSELHRRPSRGDRVIPRGALGRTVALAACLILVLMAVVPSEKNSAVAAPAAAEAPATLAETGLYANPTALRVDPGHIAFSPQYPLWTDGAEKRRWIALPPGAAIDASDPDVWDFPVGTRFWKEFRFGGKRIETRFMERLADGSWRFATYAWSADGRSAEKVSDRGRRNAHDLGGGAAHAIPGVGDCRVCHLSGPVPVLGFSARQLAADDPAATAGRVGEQFRALEARGALVGLDPMPIATASSRRSALEQAALGYLHGNCGHCHNRYGPLAKLDFDLRQSVAEPRMTALATTVGRALRSPPPGLAPGTVLRVAPGQPHQSALPQRMGSRTPALQMPPLGTALVDGEALDLINRWIAGMEPGSAGVRLAEGEEK